MVGLPAEPLVAIDAGHAAHRLRHSWSLEVAHHGEPITVSTGEPMSYTIPPWRASPMPAVRAPRGAAAHCIDDRELTSG